jgi:gliding motility-associated lipoprotein GldH
MNVWQNRNRIFLLLATCCSLLATSCTTTDLYEKTVTIKKMEWKRSYKPVFKFEIKDTAVAYQLFVTFRHSDRYNFNNVWVNLYTLSPDGESGKAQYELPLANNEKGWLATGMDDIYEHRIALTPLNQDFRFKRAGIYVFTLEHIMREDPLLQVLNVGLRIEKKGT